MPNRSAFALGTEHLAFLATEGLSILAASRGPNQIPFVARALACRLSSDFRRVTLFFSAADARELLGHVEANGSIAAIFSLPSTHDALQLKGVDARAETAVQDDLQVVSSYRRAFVHNVEQLGYPTHLIEALVAGEDIVAVVFTPTAAFSQTPGPRAGRAIGVAP
jgi:hypothetical protein